MADLEQTVSIVFDGDNSGIQSVLGNVDNDMAAFATRLGGMATAAGGVVTAIAGIGTAFVLAMEPIEEAEKIIANKLTLTPGEEEDAIAAIRRVYTAGFGESYAEVAQTAATAIQLFVTDASADLEDVTTAALGIKDAFDIDVSESIGAVSSLMDTFGIDADEAFGVVITAAENGLNASGDLADTLMEYDQHFADIGLSAGEMVNVLTQLFDPGVIGTDKVGDLVKEFNIKIGEATTAVSEAYIALGIDYDAMLEKLKAGETTVGEVFKEVIQKIKDVPNDIDALAIGTAIFGTPFEDIGVDLIQSMGDIGADAGEALGDNLGAFLDGYDQTLGEKFSRLGRTTLDAFTGSWVAENLSNALGGVADWLTEAVDSLVDHSGEADTLIEQCEQEIAEVQTLLDETPLEYSAELSEEDMADVERMMGEVGEEIDPVPLDIEAVVADENGLTPEQMAAVIDEAFGTPTDKKVEIDVDNNDAQKKVEEVIEKVDEVENQRLMEIELQGEIDTQIEQIKTTAATAQAAFEYKAKVDVAQAQADAETITAMFSSVDTAINSTGETLTGLFGMLTGTEDMGFHEKWMLEDAIEAEIEYRQQAFEKQAELIDAQVALIEARTEAMESGDGLIKIDSTGLEPALELVMWEIIEKVQVRASESTQEFLLGM